LTLVHVYRFKDQRVLFALLMFPTSFAKQRNVFFPKPHFLYPCYCGVISEPSTGPSPSSHTAIWPVVLVCEMVPVGCVWSVVNIFGPYVFKTGIRNVFFVALQRPLCRSIFSPITLLRVCVISRSGNPQTVDVLATMSSAAYLSRLFVSGPAASAPPPPPWIGILKDW